MRISIDCNDGFELLWDVLTRGMLNVRADTLQTDTIKTRGPSKLLWNGKNVGFLEEFS